MTPPPAPGASAWPAWFAPLGLVVAFAAAATFGSVLLIVVDGLSGSGVADTPSGVALVATLVQDAIFVATAVFLASRVSPVTAGDLGLLRAPGRRTVRVTLAAAGAFLLFLIAYQALIRPDGEQDTLDELGADDGTLLLVLSGLLVVGVAPFAEELLFRGFLYRSLRNRFSVAASSAIIGGIFGAIHYGGTETVDLLPVLAVLGATFCVAYERSRTLYSPIALHGVNNAIAFAATGPAGAVIVGPVVLAIVLAICILGVRGRPRGRRPTPAPAAA